jgi:hypothetical protein
MFQPDAWRSGCIGCHWPVDSTPDELWPRGRAGETTRKSLWLAPCQGPERGLRIGSVESVINERAFMLFFPIGQLVHFTMTTLFARLVCSFRKTVTEPRTEELGRYIHANQICCVLLSLTSPAQKPSTVDSCSNGSYQPIGACMPVDRLPLSRPPAFRSQGEGSAAPLPHFVPHRQQIRRYARSLAVEPRHIRSFCPISLELAGFPNQPF